MSKPRESAAGKARKAAVTITDEILDEIIERLEQGESLSGICNSDSSRLPRPSSITDLCERDAAFNVRYTRARNCGIDRLAERGLSVASDDSRDANSRRVELDAIKWFTSKMRPDKYGDASKISVSGVDGAPIQQETTLRITFDGK
jgi:hypothetical protein